MSRGLDRIVRLSALVLIAWSLFLAGLLPVRAQEPVARFILYYGETCPHCHEVMDNFLPDVFKKYGDQVEYQYVEVWNDPDKYVQLLALQTKLGVPEDRQGSVPVLIIGDKVMIGSGEIPDQLEGYIDEYLAQGGVDFPSLDDLPEVVLPTPAPAVQVLFFFDSSNPSFEQLNAYVSGLGQQYGGQLQAYAADVSTPENAGILAQINDALGVSQPPAGTPQILVDRQMLVGMDEIQEKLPGLVDGFLAQGGVSLPSMEDLLAGAPAATTTPEVKATSEPTATPGLVLTQPVEKPIYMAYFEQAGCQNCARTSYDLNVVIDQYPQLVIESFSMEEDENKTLNEWMSDKYGVPEEKRLTTPMIFVGEDVLIGTEATLNPLLEMVGKYADTGAERTWDDYDPEEAEQRLVDRFQSFGILTVFGAGLIDGLNPCAFATLVFFVSYLTFTGRKGRDILFVGISFTLGVFITYLLVGVGLLKVIQSLSFFTALGRWVYLLTAALCLVLAIFTFRDFFRARKGQASEMTLKLPMALRRRINKVIRESSQVRAFVAMAFVTGFVVSLIELACTGQVYVPTIVYVLSQPELAAQAFFYLVIYCIAFILPLIVVFVLSYFGTTSEQLGQFVNRHTSTIKAVTGVVFLALGLWMTYIMAPLFGISSPWNWVLMAVIVVIAIAIIAVLKLTDKPETKKNSKKKKAKA